MTIEFNAKRVWGSALVCFVLCCFSFIALAQERTSEPPKKEPTQENRAVLDFQKPEKVIIQERKTGDPDQPVIKGRVPNPEPRASSGYLKLGDIKGESTTATDDKHKDWINLDSVSNSASGHQTPKLKITQAPQGYECPQGDSECYCNGVLDCKNLWSSGVCQENSEWEDGNDNSKGGCIED